MEIAKQRDMLDSTYCRKGNSKKLCIESRDIFDCFVRITGF